MISITTGGFFILYTDEKILFTEFRHFLRGNVIFWNSNLVVMSIGYILRPVYPSEAAVPVEDAEKNNISKKLLLALILLVQVLAELIKIRIISVCLFYGVIMAITSVIILKKEGRKNETH